MSSSFRLHGTSPDIVRRLCRASLVMATGRLVYKTYWPELTPLFWFLSCMFLCVGATFTILAVRFCRTDQNCSNVKTCFCNLERAVIVCALIGRYALSFTLISFHLFFGGCFCWHCDGQHWMVFFCTDAEEIWCSAWQKMARLFWIIQQYPHVDNQCDLLGIVPGVRLRKPSVLYFVE